MLTNRWDDYYRATADRPPRDTLLHALASFETEGRIALFAVDLGCGSGMDTFELLRRGWRVLAIDGQPEAIARVEAIAPPEYRDRLQSQVAAFESLALLPADLINASFSLPFCAPDRFDALWADIRAALQPGGRFTGHLFGDRDGWANRADMTCHTVAQVQALLAGLVVEYFIEEENDGVTALGDPKHWHTFSIVARRLTTDD